MRKAQIAGQIFIYVLAVVISGLIIIYGYKAVISFRETSEKTSMIKFQKELENKFDEMATSYGDVEIAAFNVPNANEVCFVNTSFIGQTNKLPATANSIIKSSVESGVQKSVFLCPDCTTSFYVGQISVLNKNPSINHGFYCFKVSAGSFKIRLEGKGKYVEVSSP